MTEYWPALYLKGTQWRESHWHAGATEQQSSVTTISDFKLVFNPKACQCWKVCYWKNAHFDFNHSVDNIFVIPESEPRNKMLYLVPRIMFFNKNGKDKCPSLLSQMPSSHLDMYWKCGKLIFLDANLQFQSKTLANFVLLFQTPPNIQMIPVNRMWASHRSSLRMQSLSNVAGLAKWPWVDIPQPESIVSTWAAVAMGTSQGLLLWH